MLGELLYEGKGVRRSAVQARRMWKKAAEAGDVLAMIALGDDCMASGKGPGAALRYYRQAQTAARPTPDIAYMPQVRAPDGPIRETQYLSRPRALAEMAEAKQGFKIQLGEGDPGCRGAVAAGDGRRHPQGCWATKSGKHSFFTFALRNCHTEPVR